MVLEGIDRGLEEKKAIIRLSGWMSGFRFVISGCREVLWLV